MPDNHGWDVDRCREVSLSPLVVRLLCDPSEYGLLETWVIGFAHCFCPRKLEYEGIDPIQAGNPDGEGVHKQRWRPEGWSFDGAKEVMDEYMKGQEAA